MASWKASLWSCAPVLLFDLCTLREAVWFVSPWMLSVDWVTQSKVSWPIEAIEVGSFCTWG